MPLIHTVGPNEALVISGGGKEPRVIVGGRGFVWPIINRSQRLTLEVMTLDVQTTRVYTKEGVPVTVDGIAQVKVSNDLEAIRLAAGQFLSKGRAELGNIALQTMEGHQRAMLGTMTVESIYQDREIFAKLVREVASSDMANMGLEIVSFTIRNIQDDEGYLDALGVKRTSEVKRDAAIGLAEAERDSAIRSAQARQESEAARFLAETGIAQSEREYNVTRAGYDQQVNTRNAEAELAYELQATRTRQEIRTEEIQIEVVERERQIQVQQQEILRRENELEATVRRPSEAERYRLETIAAGNKASVLADAEGTSEAIRLRGDAEADAVRAKGLAEAAAMLQKADAWKEYGQAALVEQLLQSMPEVANAIAQPLAKTEKISIVSTGGNDGSGAGASKITRDVTNIIAQIPEVIEALTGIDVIGSIKNLPAVRDANADDTGSKDSAAAAESPSES